MPVKTSRITLESSETRSLSSQHSIGLDGATLATSVPTRMYDVVQIVLLCRQHRAILLTKVPGFDELLYFPFSTLKTGKSLYKQTKRLVTTLVNTSSFNVRRVSFERSALQD